MSAESIFSKPLSKKQKAVLSRIAKRQAAGDDSGIDSVVFDNHTSLVEGSIGAIPRRLMVAENDYSRARALLATSDAEDK